MCTRVLMVGIVLLLLCSSMRAEPSKELKGILDTSLPAIEVDASHADLGHVIGDVRHQVRVITKAKTPINVGIEYESKTLRPKLNIAIPAGTLKEQLDVITKAVGYVWQADGDWINLIPKAKVNDPKYVMNLRIPGKVVFSHGVGENTSIRKWMEEHRISSVTMLMGGQLVMPKSAEALYDLPPLPERIEINNPTLRENCNAHHAFYGEEIWTVWPERVSDGEGTTRTILTFWSSSSRPKFEDTDRSMQPKKQAGMDLYPVYPATTVGGKPALPKPSKELVAMLETKLDALPATDTPLVFRVRDAVGQAKHGGVAFAERIAIECEHGKPMPRAKAEIPAGTLKEQLDRIADDPGCIWQADGDWINLVPKGKANDPNYIMNQRIPGKVVLSRDPAKATSLLDWYSARRVSSSRDIGGISSSRVKPVPGADPIVLENPTLRQYFNAHEKLYGYDRYAVTIQVIPDKDDKQPPRISIVTNSQCTKPMAKEDQPAKQ